MQLSRSAVRSWLRSALVFWGLAGCLALTPGCGLISKDFDGTITVSVSISGDDDETVFDDIVEVDPNANPDVSKHRSSIDAGHVQNIRVKITGVDCNKCSGGGGCQACINGQCPSCVDPDNDAAGVCLECAEFVKGSVDVRSEDGASWINIAKWNDVPVVVGSGFDLEIPTETQDMLNRRIFKSTEVIPFRIRGEADRGPVQLRFDVSFTLQFSASI